MGGLSAAHLLHAGVRRDVESGPVDILSDVDVLALRNFGDRGQAAALFRRSTSGRF